MHYLLRTDTNIGMTILIKLMWVSEERLALAITSSVFPVFIVYHHKMQIRKAVFCLLISNLVYKHIKVRKEKTCDLKNSDRTLILSSNSFQTFVILV